MVEQKSDILAWFPHEVEQVEVKDVKMQGASASCLSCQRSHLVENRLSHPCQVGKWADTPAEVVPAHPSFEGNTGYTSFEERNSQK